MRIEKQKLKSVTLSLALALAMLSTNATAQYDGNRGMFGRGQEAEASPSRGMLNPSSSSDGITLQGFGENQDGITLQNFGETAPLGSGWLVLMGAGLGYAALKQKKNNKKQTK